MGIFDPPYWSTLATVGAIVFAAAYVAASVARPRRLPGTYSPRIAWILAGQYFAGCWLAAIAANVVATILRTPVLGDGSFDNLAFVSWLMACVAVEVVAYGIIWPKGTLTHGRPRRPGWQLGFGLAWGVSESLWFLSIWSVTERFVPGGRWAVAAVAFTVISAFTGIWHDKYWDIHIAPEHNIVEWNPKKVFFCHIPNLLITLTFLAVYRSPALFVMFQTLSLTLSVWCMRFPAPDDATAQTEPTNRTTA